MERDAKRARRVDPTSLEDLLEAFPYMYKHYGLQRRPLVYRGLLAATCRRVRAYILRHDESVRFMCETWAMRHEPIARRARVLELGPYECARYVWNRYRLHTPASENHDWHAPIDLARSLLIRGNAGRTSLAALHLAVITRRTFRCLHRNHIDSGSYVDVVTELLVELYKLGRLGDVRALVLGGVDDATLIPEWRDDVGRQLWFADQNAVAKTRVEMIAARLDNADPERTALLRDYAKAFPGVVNNDEEEDHSDGYQDGVDNDDDVDYF